MIVTAADSGASWGSIFGSAAGSTSAPSPSSSFTPRRGFWPSRSSGKPPRVLLGASRPGRYIWARRCPRRVGINGGNPAAAQAAGKPSLLAGGRQRHAGVGDVTVLWASTRRTRSRPQGSCCTSCWRSRTWPVQPPSPRVAMAEPGRATPGGGTGSTTWPARGSGCPQWHTRRSPRRSRWHWMTERITGQPWWSSPSKQGHPKLCKSLAPRRTS
jgi:hypothetical protein